jgi:hypothetical protein
MEDRIRLTIAGGIADVRLNHAAKMNALDPAMFLVEAVADLNPAAAFALQSCDRLTMA